LSPPNFPEVDQETIGNLIEMLPTVGPVILGVRPPVHFKNPQRQIARWPK
jgi:hypothetical protein